VIEKQTEVLAMLCRNLTREHESKDPQKVADAKADQHATRVLMPQEQLQLSSMVTAMVFYVQLEERTRAQHSSESLMVLYTSMVDADKTTVVCPTLALYILVLRRAFTLYFQHGHDVDLVRAFLAHIRKRGNEQISLGEQMSAQDISTVETDTLNNWRTMRTPGARGTDFNNKNYQQGGSNSAAGSNRTYNYYNPNKGKSGSTYNRNPIQRNQYRGGATTQTVPWTPPNTSNGGQLALTARAHCHKFQKGECTYGSSCKFAHVSVPTRHT
jgi:hypothetical protein